MAFGRWGRGNTAAGNNTAAAMAPSLWTVLLLAFASWVVLLAGVASLQQWCASGETSESDVGTRQSNYQCSQNLGLQWWNMVLELVVLLAIAGTLVSAWVLTSSRVALTALLAIVTVMLMLDTNAYLNQRRGSVGVTRHRETTYFVGAMLCSIFNFLLILVLGNHHGANAVADGAPMGKTGPGVHGTTPAAGTTTTTGPGIV